MKVVELFESAEISLEDYLLANCRPFLEKFAHTDCLLFRGTTLQGPTTLFTDAVGYIQTPRKDRRPSHMPIWAHRAADDWFKKKFGWKARSEGVFCFLNAGGAGEYGTACAMIPIGEFSVVSSRRVKDLTAELFPDHTWESRDRSGLLGGRSYWRHVLKADADDALEVDEEMQIQHMTDILNMKEYTDNPDFESHNVTEQMVNCKKYLLVQANTPKDIKKINQIVATAAAKL